MDEKTIRISAEDAGFSSTLARIKQQSDAFLKSFADGVQNGSNSLRDQIALLERKIAAERSNRHLSAKQERIGAEDIYETRRKEIESKSKITPDDYNELKGLKEDRDVHLEDIKKNEKFDDVFIKTLTDKLEELRLELKTQTLEQKRDKTEEKGAGGILSTLREQANILRQQREDAGTEEEAMSYGRQYESMATRIRRIERGEGEGAAGGGVGADGAIGAVLSKFGLGNLGLVALAGGIAAGGLSLERDAKKLSAMVDLNQNIALFGMRASAFGMQQNEYQGYAARLASARGYSINRNGVNDIEDVGYRQLGIEKGFGLGEGTLSGMNRFKRADIGGNTDVSEDINEMLQIYKRTGLFNIDKGDFTILSEKLDRLNSLNELQAKAGEKINSRTSLQVLEAFDRLGGSAADFRQGEIMSSLNQGIAAPGNQFSSAFVMNALRKKNPNASYIQLKKLQDQGIQGEGSLQAVMDELMKSGDDPEFLTTQIQSLFPQFQGRTAQAEAFVNSFLKNRKAFSGIGGSKAAVGTFLDSKGRTIEERGIDQTSTQDKVVSTVTNAFQRTGAFIVDGIVKGLKVNPVLDPKKENVKNLNMFGYPIPQPPPEQ